MAWQYQFVNADLSPRPPLPRGEGEQTGKTGLTRRHKDTKENHRKAGNHKGCPYKYKMEARGRRFRALRYNIPLVSNLARCYPADGSEVGGFSVLIRPALKQCRAAFVPRAQLFVVATEMVHGKTGPAPSGAVLFGPFSWAYVEKGRKENESWWES